MNKTSFNKDKENKKVTIEHMFDAPREKVWEAWSNPSILEKWWGPKTWPATSKSMDFREGGYWHYYMTGPDGTQSWGRLNYLTIDPPKSFTAKDAFCDQEGTKNTDFPSTDWAVEFHDEGEKTRITVVMTFARIEDMEKLIEMGFEEGFADALDNLDRIFAEV